METPPARRNRRELHMGDVKIEQKAAIASIEDHKPDVILAEHDTSLDYLSDLAFNEEPETDSEDFLIRAKFLARKVHMVEYIKKDGGA